MAHGNVTWRISARRCYNWVRWTEYAANARHQTAINGRRRFYNPDYMRYAVKTLLACLICYTSTAVWTGKAFTPVC